jgi:uncharacterized protein
LMVKYITYLPSRIEFGNGDFFPCDHFVDIEHRIGNIRDISLVELLDSSTQRAFGQAKQDTLPACCMTCEVLSICNGECPKNRFIKSPEAGTG